MFRPDDARFLFWAPVFFLLGVAIALCSGCDGAGGKTDGSSEVGCGNPESYSGLKVAVVWTGDEVPCPSPLFSDAECRKPASGPPTTLGASFRCVQVVSRPGTDLVGIDPRGMVSISDLNVLDSVRLHQTLYALCSTSGRWVGWSCTSD
jgi:hypothetical protein